MAGFHPILLRGSCLPLLMDRMLIRRPPVCQPGVHHPIEKQFEEHFILFYDDFRVIDQRLANLRLADGMGETRDVKFFICVIRYGRESLQGVAPISQQIGTFWRGPWDQYVKMALGINNADWVQARRAIHADCGNEGISDMRPGRKEQSLSGLCEGRRFFSEIVPGFQSLFFVWCGLRINLTGCGSSSHTVVGGCRTASAK